MAKKKLRKVCRTYIWHLGENIFRRERILSNWMKDLGAKSVPGLAGKYITEPLIYSTKETK